MRPITIAYFALFLNTLPLILMVYAAFDSGGFAHSASGSIGFAYSMAAAFGMAPGEPDSLKALLGTVFVPLLTAYGVEKLDPSKKLPREASILLVILFVIFVVGTVMTSMYGSFEKGLQHASLPSKEPADKPELIFRSVPWAYAKEALTYACLVIGIRSAK